MIPQGIENRLDDWSIFFLNREKDKHFFSFQPKFEINKSVKRFEGGESIVFEAIVHIVNRKTNGMDIIFIRKILLNINILRLCLITAISSMGTT
jgi:hypothetical protein